DDAHQALQATSYRQADIATEADYEYVSALGGSAAANSEILGIMNQVDGLYRQRLAITFSVTYQHTWNTSSDPYGATDAGQALNESTNYWNTNMAGQARTLAHKWTNRTPHGNTVAVASLGTVCNGADHAYGVSGRTS